MSMTETRPEASAETAGTAYDVPPEPTGLAGWFSTADHKRIGRLYLATAVVFLVGATVTNTLLGVEQLDSGLSLFDEGTFAQVGSLHPELAVLLFLVPAFLGLATYLVPLQVGSPDIAFARGSAAAYWTYLFSGLVLIASYVADGGIVGGSRVGADLYLLSMAALVLAVVVALLSILTTIVSMRAPGMTLDRTPLLAWSFLVGGGVLLLAAPVLLARLIELFVAHRNDGALGSPEAVTWFWSVPTITLLVVPAVGIVLEVVAVVSGARHRLHAGGMVVLAAIAVLGFGAFAQAEESRTGWEGLVFIALGLATVLPVLALLGMVGDTIRRGRFSLAAPMLFAIGALLHLFLGALAGAALVIEPLELDGTVWEQAQFAHLVYGAGLLGVLSALWFWAPKLWGVKLGEAVGKLVFLLVFLGALLLGGSGVVNGLVNDVEVGAAEFDDDGLTIALNAAGLAGAALLAGGALLTFGDVLGRAGRRRGEVAGADPWGGHTLEWATSSPPPRHNFDDAIPVVSSPTPMLDTRTTEVSA